jgi:ribonuclease HII
MPDFFYEQQFKGTVAGVDEVGRGTLAGPVVAGAVIFKDYNLPPALANFIDDSKKMSSKKRKELFLIIPQYAYVSLGAASALEIDKLNIRQATFLAMRRAVARLSLKPQVLLIDGKDKIPFEGEVHPLVKGDAKSLSIAAASIMAKVVRDHLMEKISIKHPNYGFQKHAGYGTLEHRKALCEYGPCPHHRFSFEPLRSLIKA